MFHHKKCDLEDCALCMIADWIKEVLLRQEDFMSTIADLVAADTQLKAEVGQVATLVQTQTTQIAALTAQIAALPTLPADQQAELDNTVADITSVNTTLSGLLPPAPPAP